MKRFKRIDVWSYLGTLREETVTYGGKYVHIADLESLIDSLVENYPVLKGSEDDTSTAKFLG